MTRSPLTLAAAAILTLAASPALAHPKLLSASPAVGGLSGPTNRLTLHFSEPLVAKFSGADLTATSMMMGGKPMAGAMKVGGLAPSLEAGDPKTLVLALKAPLSAGTYRLDWHAVSTDTHRVKGAYSFTVK